MSWSKYGDRARRAVPIQPLPSIARKKKRRPLVVEGVRVGYDRSAQSTFVQARAQRGNPRQKPTPPHRVDHLISCPWCGSTLWRGTSRPGDRKYCFSRCGQWYAAPEYGVRVGRRIEQPR